MKKLLLAVALVIFTTHLFGAEKYALDRVYTANQVSNTVSVIDPSTNMLLGEIILGKPFPNILTPLYKGASLVHGLRYDEKRKILAVVSIGSNAITFVSTVDNKILKTVYLGRAPHEPTFTPSGNEVWTTVRGEAYLSVIEMNKMEEIKRVPVADGPGMISFSNDGKFAYVCSSFTAVVDVVDTATYQSVKKIEVLSPFSPNIYTSPDGKLVALSHKDVGKITVIDTATNVVVKVFATGAITNHVSFLQLDEKLLMAVTVGGENCVKLYDVENDYQQIATIPIGVLPHGLWASPDGNFIYVGLEYADLVQAIDVKKQTALTPIAIGQSPQALVYASNAVNNAGDKMNLSPLRDPQATQIIKLTPTDKDDKANGQLAIRSIGKIELVEQLFLKLKPETVYTLALSKSENAPNADYPLNEFQTENNGKFAGQTPTVFNNAAMTTGAEKYECVILIETASKKVVMIGK